MEIYQVSKVLDAIAQVMLDKGLVCPEAFVLLEANEDNVSKMHVSYWDSGADKDKHKWDRQRRQHFRADTLEEALQEALDWANGLPDGDARRLQAFMQQVSNLIAAGEEAGIDVRYVNPLQTLMQDLSSNILTDQSHAKK